LLFPGIRKTLKEAPTSSGASAAGDAPDSWSGLLSKALDTRQLTPKSLSDAAFGVAVTGVALLEALKKGQAAPARQATPSTPTAIDPSVAASTTTPPAPTPDAKPSNPFTEALLAAVRQGAAARRRKAQGFRDYKPLNKI
jgi:hypothetical protein